MLINSLVLPRTANALTRPSWPNKVRINVASTIFQILISPVSSVPEPLASLFNGNTINEYTQSEWPVRVLIETPVVTFHIRIVVSPEPLANLPSSKKIFTAIIFISNALEIFFSAINFKKKIRNQLIKIKKTTLLFLNFNLPD